MARQLRIEYEGAFYHITSRGNERKEIFNNESDKAKFIDYLKQAFERFKVIIHVYCLMDNHYHLLMETPQANLSKAMHFINSGYTMFYNKKYRRTGHLFQGRYKSILVDKDNYATALSSYIHLNPVRAKIVKSPEEFIWSSYRYYVNTISANQQFLNTDLILGYFDKEEEVAKNKYREFVERYREEKVKDPLSEAVEGTILGNPEFIKWIKEGFVNIRKSDRELTIIKRLKDENTTVNTIKERIKEEGFKSEKLRKSIEIYLIHKYTEKGLKDIQKFYPELSISGISQTHRRLELKRANDKKLNEQLKKIEHNL